MKDSSSNDLGELLSKYIAVWIWSILFGALSGVSYSFLGAYYQVSSWGSLSLLLVILLIFGILASLQGWFFMLQYLSTYLIPKFIHPANEETDKEAQTSPPASKLKQVFLMIIVALAMRLAMELSMLIFAILRP